MRFVDSPRPGEVERRGDWDPLGVDVPDREGVMERRGVDLVLEGVFGEPGFAACRGVDPAVPLVLIGGSRDCVSSRSKDRCAEALER